MKKLVSSLAFAAVLPFAAVAEEVNLVPNGSFEQGTDLGNIIAIWYGCNESWAPDGTFGWRGAGVVSRGYYDGYNCCMPKGVPIPHGMYADGVKDGQSLSNVVTVAEAGDYVLSFHYVCGTTDDGRKYTPGQVLRVFLGDLETPVCEVTNDVTPAMVHFKKTVTLAAGTYPLVFTGVAPETGKGLTMFDDVRLYLKKRSDSGATVTVEGRDYVYLVEDATATNAFVNGAVWSDGVAPNGTADYLVYDDKTLDWPVKNSTFPGRSLTIGTPDSDGTFNLTLGASIAADIAKGVFWRGSLNVLEATTEERYSPRLRGSFELRSPAAHPFVIRGNDDDLTHVCNFAFYGNITGEVGTAVLITGENPGGGGKGFVFNNDPDSKGAAYRPFTPFKGRIIVDGTNTTYNYSINDGAWTEGVFGADPGEFTADAFTLRNGAKLYLKNHAFNYMTCSPNRGMKIENGARVSFGGVYATAIHYFNFPVFGTGTLTMSSTLIAVLCQPITVDSLVLESGTYSCTEDFDIGAETAVTVASNVTWTIPAKGLSPKKVVLENGSKLVFGVGNDLDIAGSPRMPAGVTYSRYRPRHHRAGTLRLSPTSEIRSTPVSLALESVDVSGTDERFAVLVVPTSVRLLGDSDFETGGLEIEIETTGDEQTVYVKRDYSSTAYVVPPGTPGVVPTAPYASWETAATNVQDAIDAAAADSNVRVRKGVYLIEKELTIAKRIRLISVGDDGGIAPEETIFDGGYPAQSNRCLLCSSACSIHGFTFRNGYADNGGGIKTTAKKVNVYDCVFTNCIATGSGGAIRHDGNDNSSGFFVERTTFVDCRAGGGNAVSWWANNGVTTDFPAVPYCLPTIIDCTFLRGVGTANDKSGALEGWMNGGAWLQNCLFEDNTGKLNPAFSLGGYSFVTNCVFRENENQNGNYGVISGGDGHLRMADCVLCGSAGNGGLFRAKGAEFVRCAFTNNLLRLQTDYNFSNRYVNCLIAQNERANVGSSRLENCTIARNRTAGVNINKNTQTPTLVNCAIAENENGDFVFDAGSAENVTLRNCCVGEATEELLARDETGCSFSAKPRFGASERGNYRLKSNSPLRDKALTLDWMTEDAVDLDGKPRRISLNGRAYPDSLPDVGCYECDIPKPGFLLQVW